MPWQIQSGIKWFSLHWADCITIILIRYYEINNALTPWPGHQYPRLNQVTNLRYPILGHEDDFLNSIELDRLDRWFCNKSKKLREKVAHSLWSRIQRWDAHHYTKIPNPIKTKPSTQKGFSFYSLVPPCQSPNISYKRTNRWIKYKFNQ